MLKRWRCSSSLHRRNKGIVPVKRTVRTRWRYDRMVQSSKRTVRTRWRYDRMVESSKRTVRTRWRYDRMVESSKRTVRTRWRYDRMVESSKFETMNGKDRRLLVCRRRKIRSTVKRGVSRTRAFATPTCTLHSRRITAHILNIGTASVV